ncbi:uncharacterized protein LOC144661371 isoform X2 [Oculina patagonica]
MGGNIKLYDDHIALTSPRKKLIKTPKRSYKILDQTMESSLNDSPARSALSENFGSMDMTPRISNAPVKKGFEINEILQDRSSNMTVENKVKNELESNEQIRAALERLRLADSGTVQLSKSNTASSSIADSIAKVDSWKTDFDNCNSPSHVVEGIGDSRVQETNYVSTISDGALPQQREDTSSGNGARARDYSPIRSTPVSVNPSNLKDDIKPSIDTRVNSNDPGRSEEQLVNEPDATTNDSNSRFDVGNKNYESKGGEIQDPERMNRYNRTLLYVNEQNETLQNGDYNELNIDLSDLSSDVFTDSEIPTSGFLSQSRDGKSDLDFYPDSPTTEQAFSKTPCSSRKNSLESYMSDDSMSVNDIDIKTAGGQKKIHKLVPNGGVHSNSHMKQNGKAKQPQGTKTKLSEVKAKVGSLQKLKNKPGGAKNETKKIDFNKKAKSKVNSFGNIGHVPGGGKVKVQADKVSPHRRVEPRTDTHGVEAYSYLPSEFQEIAKRLAKQDRQLRNSKISGSSSSGRSRPRSRRSSHGSSRAGSVSPDRRLASKPNFRLGRLSGSSFNLNTSTISLGPNSPNKTTRRPSINRTPSIRSRPTTPSLSRSHPATFVTPYDSRSRPSSRPSSRPNSRPSSPVRSRNASPTNGRYTQGSSPAPNYRKSSKQNRTSPSSNRSKTRMSNGMGGRSTNLTGLSSVEIGLASGSVFQVIPVHK